MINHTVLFGLKHDCDESISDKITKEFINLGDTIPEILQISGGKNVSKEGLSKNYSLGFSLLFRDADTLSLYLENQEHKLFVSEYVNRYVQDVVVFDYVVGVK